ncbi:MAG: glycosyltransferase family 39 protein, partial [Nitrospirae bacterium]|nr:glycosyltransferase family 39 protein [Nitrospirota bacterium]
MLFGQRDFRASVLIVSLYGALLGYFLWQVFFDPIPITYRPTWQAPWITYPDGEVGQSYYRKKIYLAGPVRHGWLKVMALDSDEVYVNGVSLGVGNNVSTSTTHFIDLSTALKSGANLIAVATHRQTYPGTSRIAVEGKYTDWQGETYSIVSDETWKTAPYREKQIDGGPEWYQSDFDDHLWKKAKVIGLPQPKDNSTTDYPFQLYTAPMKGRWVWGPSPSSMMTYARLSFTPPDRVGETWVRIAAMQGYSLFVNGLLIGKTETFIGAKEPITAKQLTLDMVNITPFLRKGRNVIGVAAFGERSNRAFFVDGVMLNAAGRERWFATPEGWTSSFGETAGWTSRTFDDAQWAPVQPIGTMTTPEEVGLTRQIVEAAPPDSYGIKHELKRGACMALGAAAMLGLWWGMGVLASSRKKSERLPALAAQRPAYLWAGLVLAGVILLGYDVRFDPAYSYQGRFAFLSLALLIGLQLLPIAIRGDAKEHVATVRSVFPGLERLAAAFHLTFRRLSLGLLILILVGGFLLRLKNIDYEPLGGDEVTMALVSHSTLTYGYPILKLSPDLPPKYATTSEIVPYPMALSILLFGLNEFAIRFPGVFFGTLTILLLYYAGRRIFDERVGFLAAGIFSFLPFAINMSHYARYPSQVQFFALLTTFLFYRAVQSKEVQWRPLYGGLVAYILTYLSWEGSAFLVPALFLGLIFMKRRDLSWLKDHHLWTVVGLLGLMVFFQLSGRYLLNRSWMPVGSGVSQIALVPLWLQPLYDPWVYYTNLLILENLQVVSLLAALGLLWMVRDRALAYVNGTLIVALFFMTNFLETQGARHVYYLLPLLILSGARAFWALADAAIPPTAKGLSRAHAALGVSVRYGMLILFLITTGSYVLKLYNLPGTHTVVEVRMGLGGDSGVKK